MASPTLAELRAQSGPKPRPKATRTVTLVEGQHLLDAAQRLDEERADLQLKGGVAAQNFDEDGNRTGPPLKAGQGAQGVSERTARLEEIAEEMRAIVVRLADFQAEVEMLGVFGGEWQRFKDANPPREDSQFDRAMTRNACNATTVFESLGSYVVKWNGEDVDENDWDSWLAERITYSDRRDMIADVVDMHEKGMVRAPKSPSSSSPTKGSAND